MENVPDRSTFESMYAGQAPWDIGKPQKPFIDSADRISGTLLDAGCGTGDTSLFFAGRGCKVTGLDYLDVPIERARTKAANANLPVNFIVGDALKLGTWTERFDNVVDSGLFHVFSDDDRRTYVKGLANVLKPGGRVYLLCFSNEEPAGNPGPRRITKQELHEAFDAGWEIESINPVQIEIHPSFKDAGFSSGGPKAWFSVIRRV
jgi:cyclopropane fatty-acyl-phospholipid synthase-like methyltransferase